MSDRIEHLSFDFTAKARCGHCGVASVFMIPIEGQALSVDTRSNGYFIFGQLLCRCGHCDRLSLFAGKDFEIGTDTFLDESRSFLQALVEGKGTWQELYQYPEPSGPKIPEDIPLEVRSIFEQAELTLFAKSWSLAGVGYRTAIDRAVQKLGEKNDSLFKRIERLKESYRITPDLADWAHHVRLGGNAGTHDLDDLSEEDAKELRDFTKLFLEMTFTMPKKIADAKEKRAAKKAGAS